MGCFDSVYVPCPNCGELNEFQSKSGDCLMQGYDVTEISASEIPMDVLYDVNRHSPCRCKCGASYSVKVEKEQREVTLKMDFPTKVFGVLEPNEKEKDKGLS